MVMLKGILFWEKMYRDLEELLLMRTDDLMDYAAKRLFKADYTISRGEKYVFAQGWLPVLLVAHADVYGGDREDKVISLDETRKYVVSNGILGGDDRAGIYAIFRLVDMGASVLITDDEENGKEGAYEAVEDRMLRRTHFKFLIQLDRRGVCDAVFYGCDNRDFINYILSFGFRKANGVGSDITVLMPELDRAGVNLSVGFFNEHTKKEYLSLRALQMTIERVRWILEDVRNYILPVFRYEGVEDE